jgi:hypothetical protein
MNDTSRIDYLAGQVNALMPLMLALANTHPNLQLLEEEFKRLGVRQENYSLPNKISEAFLQGQSDATREIGAHLATLRKARG